MPQIFFVSVSFAVNGDLVAAILFWERVNHSGQSDVGNEGGRQDLCF